MVKKILRYKSHLDWLVILRIHTSYHLDLHHLRCVFTLFKVDFSDS